MCLISGFKDYIEIGKKTYRIRTDFRVWLKVYEIINTNLPADEKVVALLSMVYLKLPDTLEEALGGIMDFFSGKTPEKKSQKKLFDFGVDAELIFAAFMEQYRINLIKEDMHWHEFLALFKALNKDTLFMHVLSIRNADATKIKDDEKRLELLKLKKVYALPKDEMEEKENEELILRLKRKAGDERCQKI